jgi:flagellin-like hook-associated protein FlgL
VNIGAAALNLFSGGGFGSSSVQSIDLSALTPQANPVQRTLTERDFARMAPWDSRVRPPPLSSLARNALSATRLLETGLGNGPGSNVTDPNDKALFVIHNGIRKLQALADAAAQDGVSATDRAQFQKRIEKGIAELNTHVNATKLDGAYLLAGKRVTSLTTDIAGNGQGQYDSKVLASGASGAVPLSFEGDRRFDLTVTKASVPTTLSIDLAGMGATERTMLNVTAFINTQLNAAGFESRITAVETKVAKPAPSTDPKAPKPPQTPDKYEQRLRVTVAIGEALKFEAAAGDTQPALFVAGAKKIDGTSQSVVSKLTDLGGTTTAAAFDTDLSAIKGATATARAIASGPDGSVYVIADATGKTNGQTPKSSRDVELIKYDTTGQVVWTRALGSAAPAEGFSIAVGANGTIAVAGAVDGKADKATSTTGDQRDSFVAAFDKEGRDLWYHQQGAIGNDSASHVAVADDGMVFVVGTTTESYGGAGVIGGKDVYLQGFDTTGAVTFTNSLGSAGDDIPAGLVLQNGDPLVVWNQTDGPRMASYDGLTGAAIGSIDPLTATGLGNVSSVAVDESGRLFLAGAANGSATNDRVVGLDLSTNNVLFQAQSASTIRSITAAGGQVAYATDASVIIPATATTAETTGRETRVIGLSAQTGAAVFDRASSASATGAVSMTLVADSSKSLDAMGLPEGELLFGDTSKLTDRTGLRPGDSFNIAVNDRTAKKIEIAAGETLRTLAAKISRVLLRDGKAEVRTIKGNESLVITPFTGDRISISGGPTVNDALKQLGLEPGVAIARPPVAAAGTKTVSAPPPVVALEIPTSGDVSDKAKAKTLADAFDGVLRRIRIGYREVSDDPTQVALRKQIADGAKKKSGSTTGIAYYQQQAAAGQEALRRLGVLA